MAAFNDNFSKQASIYAQFRPSYPHELYDYLQSLSPAQALAWDCGTGNGQSAIHLADYFDHVHASDPSEAQIENAFEHERVSYHVETAEKPSLSDNSVDLITVAQAIHWFQIDQFYEVAKRVMKKNGIIAIWAYATPTINPEIDRILLDFHDRIVGPYWPEEINLLRQGYMTIPFPFREIEPPEFYIRKSFKLQDLLGHLLTWSATQRFIQQEQVNPIGKLQDQLMPLWADPQKTKQVTWKIMMRVGKLPS
ncbi:class I SAM-dependent methyltransferase [Sphingobacterium lactis]|uniref:Methyltransferase domain-containing protein n=1 Tax=Sphingobacterium lactis TaxID=797291 RepID=A0A1H6BI85_9SPHI|nr:class I SAM-dependent methyltransferase [Sphingobacterium lactis]SEG60077.1 Methyltransferase domain-containing protein [Sphingobacterium lactis]